MGFSLFWSSFYTALIHNAAIDDTAAVEISSLAPVALCAGMVVMAKREQSMVGFSRCRKGIVLSFGLREPRCSRGRLAQFYHRLARPRARCIRGELSSGNRAFRASAFCGRSS